MTQARGIHDRLEAARRPRRGKPRRFQHPEFAPRHTVDLDSSTTGRASSLLLARCGHTERLLRGNASKARLVRGAFEAVSRRDSAVGFKHRAARSPLPPVGARHRPWSAGTSDQSKSARPPARGLTIDGAPAGQPSRDAPVGGRLTGSMLSRHRMRAARGDPAWNILRLAAPILESTMLRGRLPEGKNTARRSTTYTPPSARPPPQRTSRGPTTPRERGMKASRPW